jgi:hypothetical protein
MLTPNSCIAKLKAKESSTTTFISKNSLQTSPKYNIEFVMLKQYGVYFSPKSSSPVSAITSGNKYCIYIPKTDLGKKLVKLRENAIAQGMRLLTVEEINKEVAYRRGEID